MNERDDPIIDVCLEEFLGGCAPPDLTDRIMDALRNQPNASAMTPPVPTPSNLAKYDFSGEPAAPPVQGSSLDEIVQIRPVQTSPNHSAPQRQRATRVPTASWEAFAIASTVVAVVLLALTAVHFGSGSDVATMEEKNGNSVAKGLRTGKRKRPSRLAKNPTARQPDRVANDDGSKGLVVPDASPAQRPEVVAAGGNKSQSVGREPRYAVPDKLADRKVVDGLNTLMRDLWASDAATPAKPASEEVWANRTYQRLWRRSPNVNELKEFLESDAETRREALVDRLLESEEFLDQWSDVWTTVLVGRRPSGGEKDSTVRGGLKDYLRESMREGKAWDKIAVELITARGSNDLRAEDYNGATNFLISAHDDLAASATNRTARAFLGERLRCLQCHDDSNEQLSQSRFWELSAFFRQMKVENIGQHARVSDVDFKGEGVTATPHYAPLVFKTVDGREVVALPSLDGAPEVSPSGQVAIVNRRVELGHLVSGSNKLSRATVNRVWAYFFGYGLSNPVDDMGPHNEPVSEKLLGHLAGQFRAHNHDLRSLVRWVVLSEPFALSAQSHTSLADVPYDGRPLFSHYYGDLNPEGVVQSLTSVAEAIRSGEIAPHQERARKAWLQKQKDLPKRDASDGFLDLRQSLIIKPALAKELSTTSRGMRYIRRLVASKLSRSEKIDHLFLAAVARKPTREEGMLVYDLVDLNAGDHDATLQDIWWSLSNSSEYLLDLDR